MADIMRSNINLADFIEAESGVMLNWKQVDVSACSLCPMPWHNDSKPSFWINKLDDGKWVFHCFGCHAKGTIINYCMECLGKEDYEETIEYLAEKFNIDEITDVDLASYKFVINRLDEKRQIECANILTSNQCRYLLQNNFEKHQQWVTEAYKKLNISVDSGDLQTVENIGHEASERLYYG